MRGDMASSSYAQIPWTVYACYKVTVPGQEKETDLQTCIPPESLNMSVGKEKIPLDAYRFVGLAIRDGGGGGKGRKQRYEEIRIDTQKRADKPALDLVSEREAWELAAHVHHLLTEHADELKSIKSTLESAQGDYQKLVAGIQAFYGDADHVPVGIAKLYEVDDDY
jgi:hypothetical protein